MKYLVFITGNLLMASLYAQTDKKLVRQGNGEFRVLADIGFDLMPARKDQISGFQFQHVAGAHP